jgi:hypothetical protein
MFAYIMRPSSSSSSDHQFTKETSPFSLCLLLSFASPPLALRAWYIREQNLRNVVLLLRSYSG